MSGQTATARWRGRLERFGSQLVAALTYPFSSGPRLVTTLVLAALTFVLLILSTFPTYTMQMLGAGVQRYLVQAFVDLFETTYQSVGVFGVGLIVAYAVLTGVALVNAAAQLRVAGVSSLSDLTGVVPGLLASGCASCGAGLLGFLGFTGALAAMPFHGDLLRVGGLLLLLFFLGRAGDPRQCRLT
ncbi:hypothetical protein SAMN04487948_104469 [Halogranum amylolyticum]|uniref:Uncharacterized protein n=1 Tax=Halogranum amylolyticum TaxID=660520 RepID=A0A1H8S5A1_9EURY|nr:hypothetical protein [Halogranum amylolyticum]SEO73805.1 hypothetical protein SAMN04487948_104469 [Halogranum amylolyticum]